MGNAISERLLDQRLRNRLMEAVNMLADGAAGVRAVGADDYFEYVYDFMNDRVPWPNSAMTDAEHAEFANLAMLLNKACDATRPIHDDEELIATGWPERIAPQAQRVSKLFALRGRFDEDVEEQEPGRSDLN